MTPRSLFAASLLTGVVLTSLGLGLTGDAGVPNSGAAARRPLPAQSGGEADLAALDGTVQSILASPLFDPTRHAGATGSAAQDKSSLPRLSGTMITAAGRLAIFAVNEADKPVVVPEGGQIGAFRVESIALGHVVLAGPDGRHTLQTAFSATNTPQPQEAPK